MKGWRVGIICFVLSLVALGPARAQSFYTNNVGLWSLAANWTNGTATAGSALVFNTAAMATNDVSNSMNFDWVVFRNNVTNLQAVAGTYYSFSHFTNETGNTALWNIGTLFSNTSATICNQGSLTFAGSITNDSQLTVQGAGNTSITAPVAGTGSLTKTGAGTLILFGTNTYVGTTIIQRGAVLLAANYASNINASAICMQGGGVIGTTGTMNQTFLTWLDSKAQSGTIVTGAVGLSASTGSNLSFTNNLAQAFLGAWGTAATVSNAATWADNIVRLGGGNNALTYAPAIGNGTNLLVGPPCGDAASVVILTNAANSVGGTIINSGTLQLGNGASSGNNAKLGGGTITNNATLAFNFSAANKYTNANYIIGNGAVSLAGGTSGSGGWFLFTNANTYTGNTLINGSEVRLVTANALGSGAIISSNGAVLNLVNNNLNFTNTLILLGSTLKVGSGGAGSCYTGPITLDAGSTNLLAAAVNFTIGGVIGGAGALELDNYAGRVTLSSSNTFSGPTLVGLNAGGTLLISNSLALQNSTLMYTNGTVQFGAGITNITLGNLAGTANIGLQTQDGTPKAVALAVGGNDSTNTYSGVLSQSGSLMKLGTGTLTFSGANSYSGGTFINNGTLNLTGSGTVGSGSISIASGATLDASGRTSTFILTSGQSLINRGTVVGGLIVGNNFTASGGGYYAGAVTNLSGGTLTPGTGGDTNYFQSLTLAGGSTNAFWVGSVASHDMSVVSNSLAFTGSGHPVLTLDLSSYVQSANPTNGVIMLYQNFGSSAFDGTNQWFTLSDGGPNSNWNLRNGTTFEAVGGSSATNEFTIWYDLDTTGTSIALTVIPEPASVNLLLMLGAACWIRRQLHGKKHR